MLYVRNTFFIERKVFLFLFKFKTIASRKSDRCCELVLLTLLLNLHIRDQGNEHENDSIIKLNLFYHFQLLVACSLS